MSAEHHDTGKAYLPNLAPGVSPAFEPVVQSGRALVLGATNDLPIPIHHTLGAEEFDGYSSSTGTSVVDNLDGSWTITGVSPSRYLVDAVSIIEAEAPILYTFSADITSGTCIITGYHNGTTWISLDTPYTVVSGSNKVELQARGTDFISVQTEITSDFVVTFSDNSVKEINSMANSFITIDDIANDEIIQIGNAVDGGSKEKVINGEFNDGTNDWIADCWVSGTNDPTLSVNASNQMVIQNHVDSGYGTINQALPTRAGTLCEISVTWIDSSQVVNMAFRIGTTLAGYNILDASGDIDALGTYTYTFTPLGDTTYIAIGTSNDAGGYAIVDNISIKEILPTSTEYILNDVTVNNILTHQMPFSAGDLNLIQQEPNLLAALAMGEATPISSVTLDADDSWYACSEVSGAFVVDQRAGYGVVNAEVDSYLWQNINNVDTVISENEHTFDNTVSTGNVAVPRVIAYVNKSNLILKFKATYTVHSGTAYIDYVFSPQIDGGSGIQSSQLIGEVGVGTYINEGFCYGSGNVSARFNGVTHTTFSATLKIEIQEATASEIANYNSNIRLTNQQKGLQTTALLLDNAGVPESYNSTANTDRVYDDTVINTGLKPNLDVMTIEESVSGELQDFGSELVANWDFSLGDNGDWTKQDLWVIEDGLAKSGETGNRSIYQNLADAVVGKQYIVNVNVSAFTEGGVRITYGGVNTATFYQGGVHTAIITATSTSPTLYVNGLSIFIGEVTSASVKELTTRTQRTEKRVLTHDKTATPQDKYYIDTILQDVTPPLPSSTTSLDVGSTTALIGYADTVDTRYTNFRVYSKALTQAEIDAL